MSIVREYLGDACNGGVKTCVVGGFDNFYRGVTTWAFAPEIAPKTRDRFEALLDEAREFGNSHAEPREDRFPIRERGGSLKRARELGYAVCQIDTGIIAEWGVRVLDWDRGEFDVIPHPLACLE